MFSLSECPKISPTGMGIPQESSVMILLWTFVFGLIPFQTAAGTLLLPREDKEFLSVASDALAAILRATSRPECSLMLITDGRSYSTSVYEVLRKANPLTGTRVFESSVQEQNINETRQELNSVVSEATLLRKSYHCVILVAASNDPDFVESFFEAHQKDLLLLWKQRPIVITSVALESLKTLMQRYYGLFTTGAVVIHTRITSSTRTRWISVYSHSPSSPADGGQVIKIATWTSHKGLVPTPLPEIVQNDSRKISVKEALKDPMTMKDLLSSPGTFKFQVPVLMLIGVEHWFPHVIIKKKIEEERQFELGGSMSNLLSALAQSLNFKYRLVRPADGEWGSKKADGRWSGMVGQVYYQETDIALGPHDLTESRKTAIDYTTPIFNDARKFIVGQSRAEVDPWGFLLPLTPLVWVGVLLSLFIVASITTAIGDNYRGDPPLTYASTVLLHTYRILVVQGLTMKLEKISERMVVCLWTISAMIICWSYSTNLMSLLAVRYAPRPIQTIRDLLDNKKMSVIITPNTALTDYIENIDSGLLREIVNLRSVGRYKDIHFTEFPKVLGTLVRRGDHVIATDTTDGTRLIANYFSQVGSCNFYLAREAFVPFVMGMIGQQGSPLVEALTHRIGSIVAGGMYRHWLDSNFANSSSCRYMPSRFTVREPLAIINIWGLFVLLISGLSIAGITFLLEVILATGFGWQRKDNY